MSRPSLPSVASAAALEQAMELTGDRDGDISPTEVAETDWYKAMFSPELRKLQDSKSRRKGVEDEIETKEEDAEAKKKREHDELRAKVTLQVSAEMIQCLFRGASARTRVKALRSAELAGNKEEGAGKGAGGT